MKIEFSELRAFEALSVFLRECGIETCKIEYKGEHLYNTKQDKHIDFIVNSVDVSMPCLELDKIKSDKASWAMLRIGGQWDFWGVATIRFLDCYENCATTQEATEEEQPLSLLERTGYSYSGISDIIRNKPESAKELIEQLDEKYNHCVKKQEEIEKELEQVQLTRKMCVSAFMYVNAALKLGDKPLVFQSNEDIVVVKTKGQNTIDYQKLPITKFN